MFKRSTFIRFIGYFIVRYDFENLKIEVINTNGYNGNYTLEQLQQLQQVE